MKRLFVIFAATVSLFCFASVSYAEDNDADSLKEQINSIESEVEQLESEKADLQERLDELEGVSHEDDEDVQIVAEYIYPRSTYIEHIFIVKNNTGSDAKISSKTFAYNADGSLIAYGEGSLDVLGAGCTSILIEPFDTEEEIAYFETDISTDNKGHYSAVDQDLSFTENDINGGAIFQVTNNGNAAARFVKCYALFFLNGELVDYDSSYFTDDDSEIKPGETITNQMTTYNNYDTIEFYLTGRR